MSTAAQPILLSRSYVFVSPKFTFLFAISLTFISTRLSFIFYGGSASGKVWFVLHECERAQMAISSPLKEELAPGYVGVKVLYGGSGRKYFRQEHLTVAKKSFFVTSYIFVPSKTRRGNIWGP